MTGSVSPAASFKGSDSFRKPSGDRAAVFAVLAAMAAVVLDAGMTVIALPSVAGAFGIRPSSTVQAISAYQAALVMALLPCAAIGERFGFRRVFLAGAGLFTLALLASATAASFQILLAARFAQGIGAAAILALGVALLRFTVSDARLGEAISWNALTVALSGAAAPAICGLLLSVASWAWIYIVPLPLCACVFICGRYLPVVAGTAGRLKIAGVGLNAAGFGLLISGASRLSDAGWIAGVLVAAGALCLCMLLRAERHAERPLVPADLLANRQFRVSAMASVLLFAGQATALVALPFHLQGPLGLTPGTAGGLFVAWPLSVAITTSAARSWITRSPAHASCATGGLILAAGLLALASLPMDEGVGPLVVSTCFCGAGFGVFQVANNRSMFLAAPPQRSGAAGGLQGMARVSGQTIGAILAGALLAAAVPATGGRAAFAAGAMLCLSAALLSYFAQRPRSDAPSTP